MSQKTPNGRQFDDELLREYNLLQRATDEASVAPRMAEIEEALLGSIPRTPQQAAEILTLVVTRISTARVCEGGEDMLPLAESAVGSVADYLRIHFSG